MKTCLTAAALVAAVASQSAYADPSFSTINNNGPEVNQATLLSVIYGGTWTPISGTQNYTNGSMTAYRVADGGYASPLNMLAESSTAADEVWAGGEITITARAKYAGDTHTFGWIDGASPTPTTSNYQVLLSTSTLDQPVTAHLTESFRWALFDITTNQLLTSRPQDNPDGLDHMITYRMVGAGFESPTWLIAWEDRTTGLNSDRDFNDVAIEVVATSVPEPGTAALLATGGLLSSRRRREGRPAANARC
jgi:hypothetical protein